MYNWITLAPASNKRWALAPSGIFGGDRDDEAFLAQYFIPVKKDDRLLVTYVLLKLGMLDGRGIL
ncbi:MAG: hypothetical protein AAF213_07585, partial [Pseudomonadota bacterium]